MLTIPELYEAYRTNMYPAMVDVLAEQIHATKASINGLGVGYNPDHQAWIFPERDALGDVIGLVERYHDGKKLMIKGSKRGLTYILNPNFCKGNKYVPGKQNWVRVNSGIPCPICGKPDWCLVSNDEPYKPSSDLCARTSEGSRKEIPGCGFLHQLGGGSEVRNGSHRLLGETSRPIIVVEGASDVLAATDIGFVAIGRPSATAKTGDLQKLCAAENVIIIGENDEAGRKGMDLAFNSLLGKCPSVIKVLPPSGVNDLREWVKRDDLTADQLLKWVKEHGKTGDADIVFEDDIAYNIAEIWLNRFKTTEGYITLRNYAGQWVEFGDGRYQNLSENELRGQVYSFLKGKQVVKFNAKGEREVTPYKPTRAKVSDILDAMNEDCPINTEPPVWLDDKEHPDPLDLIVFQNGMLDINDKTKLERSTPAFFSYNIFPYGFDPKADSKLWYKFINEIFRGDKDRIRLLAQWFGYNLVPDMTYEKMMLFMGKPRSGKSTTMETMAAMLGANQCAFTSLSTLTTGFGFQNLVGKYAALIGDAKTPRRNEAAVALEKILQITGGDAINISRKYLTAVDTHLKCRFTMSMNDLPAFTDHARALEPRMLILDFDRSFVGEEDFSLKTRLKQEAAEGKLINFALNGLEDLREQGTFTIPGSSKRLLDDFVELVSPVQRFVEECCMVDPDSDFIIPSSRVYEAWQHWCDANGHRPGKKCQFGRWLVNVHSRIIKSRRRTPEGDLIYTYSNLELQPWVYSQYLGRPG